MNKLTNHLSSFEENISTKKVLPFELFYLCELLAEGIITKELFDKTYNKLLRELNLSTEEKELEL